MRSFHVQIDDGGKFGIEENFSLFAQDSIEAAIKAQDLLNALQELIRQTSQIESDFPETIDCLRVGWISDQGELTGGDVVPNSTWAEEFARPMMERIKQMLC